MQDPFDLELNGTIYSVFPEEEEIYTIFKEGVEYMKIQKDTDSNWLKLDDDTDLPLFEENIEANQVGRAILNYLG